MRHHHFSTSMVVDPVRWLAGVVFLVAALGTVPAVYGQEPLPPGSALPSIDASLQRVSEGTASVAALKGDRATVFLFWSNQCPWVDKYESRVQALVSEFQENGIQFVLVNANDASASSQESLAASQKRAKEQGYTAPYVRDPNATLARALGATRTPHVFVFDDSETLVYEGAIDDSPGDPERVESAYLKSALSALVRGDEVPVSETKAFGCTLRYPSK